MSTPETGPGVCWRVFPWDSHAPAGARFSPSRVPEPTGRGRFDLLRDLSPVLYLAERPAHAVGEMLQPWRGQRILPAHLNRAGFPLALVEVRFPPASARKLADFCDPAHLAATGTAPDTTASRSRGRTQPIARSAWDSGHHGLRWWSSFWGEWHTVVLFTARLPGRLRFGEPEVLTLAHPAVREAADLLGMEVR
ncbi:MAG TPA: RES family NAD+ phosphorylase [Longimicrobiales bacterium]|nr:RES family NAD+ phosphorylase [Longimicrobiales bacterium]